MVKNKNTILVAFDGSQKAFKTIEYLCSFKPFLNKNIVLYNAIDSVPGCYYDIKKDPFSHGAMTQVKAWEMGHRAKMESYMAEARMMLIATGFKSEAITIAIKKKIKGIARDILAEAQKGYYALLIRRRGWSASILPIPLGSISTKIIGKGTTIPILLAGVKKINHSILIAIDGSDGSKRAVEFLAKTVKDTDCRIVLLSVVRDCEMYDEKIEENKSTYFTKIAFEEFESAISETILHLRAVGIKPEKITTKIMKRVKSRADAIIETAKDEGCDTIVFGRKGKSEVASFGIGQVPWKVIHGDKKITVWIIP